MAFSSSSTVDVNYVPSGDFEIENGQLLLDDDSASVAAPSLAWESQTDLGLWAIGSGIMGFATAAVEAARLTAPAATVGITQLQLNAAQGGYGSGVTLASPLATSGASKEMAKIVADGEAAWDSASAASQDSALSLWTTLNGTLTKRMTISSSGSVRILSESGAAFQIEDTGSFATDADPHLIFNDSSVTGGRLGFTNPASNEFGIYNDRSAGDIVVQANTGGAVDLRSNGAQSLYIYSSGLVELLRGDLLVGRSVAGGEVVSRIYNTNNTLATSNATVRIETGGTSAGDPRVNFTDGTNDWTIGKDTSDSNSFVFAASSALGTSNAARLSTGGNLWLAGALGVGNSAAATTLGSVTDKVEIFDASGASIGFIPVYDAIT